MALSGEDPEDSSGDANGGDWRRRDGRISGRDGSGVRRDASHGRRVAIYLPACVYIFGASGNARGGAASAGSGDRGAGKKPSVARDCIGEEDGVYALAGGD